MLENIYVKVQINNKRPLTYLHGLLTVGINNPSIILPHSNEISPVTL